LRVSRSTGWFSHLELWVFEVYLARKLRFHIFNLHFLRVVSHGSFVFTSWSVSFWRMSRTKASFSHLQLSLFEGCLARKLRFHILLFSSFRFWGRSSMKASLSHLPLRLFQGSLARQLRFHIVSVHFLREVSHESFAFTSSTFSFWGKSCAKCIFER
jgi:hypothetical protein